MKELYINSKLVELDSQTRLDLQFKSFLFSGISELTAPRSWTVSLPKSASNLALIEGASAGDSDSAFPYDNYVVDYYSKGYRVINQGKGILIKITDRIEFAFTFGKAYEAIKLMSETKLTELTDDGFVLDWNTSIKYNNMLAGYGWCNWYNYTIKDRSYTTNSYIPSIVTHPSITFKWLIDLIGTEFTLDLSGLSGLTKMDKYAFPLRNKDGVFDPYNNQNTNITIGSFDRDASFTYPVLSNPNNFIKVVYGTHDSRIYLNPLIFNSTDVINVKIFGYINVELPAGDEAELRTFKNGVFFNLGSYSNLGSYLEYSFEIVTTLTTSDYILLKFSDSLQDIYLGTVSQPSNVTVELTDYKMQSFYLQKFYIIPNLPDMTCADFLFQAMQLAGVFASISDETPNVIDFFSADVLYENLDLGLSKDWTNKLVKTNPRMNELSDVAFKFGNYSKKNILKYKADETNLFNTSSELIVDNNNLEAESNLVELKFAAGKRFSFSDTTIDYPLYDTSFIASQFKATYSQPKNDVIAEIVNVSGVNYLKFTNNLLWSSLKAANYSGYQSIIESPRYLREKFYLKPEDVADISLEIPISLAQYGKYYAVMQIQYKEDEISECELLELKNI